MYILKISGRAYEGLIHFSHRVYIADIGPWLESVQHPIPPDCVSPNRVIILSAAWPPFRVFQHTLDRFLPGFETIGIDQLAGYGRDDNGIHCKYTRPITLLHVCRLIQTGFFRPWLLIFSSVYDGQCWTKAKIHSPVHATRVLTTLFYTQNFISICFYWLTTTRQLQATRRAFDMHGIDSWSLPMSPGAVGRSRLFRTVVISYTILRSYHILPIWGADVFAGHTYVAVAPYPLMLLNGLFELSIYWF